MWIVLFSSNSLPIWMANSGKRNNPFGAETWAYSVWILLVNLGDGLVMVTWRQNVRTLFFIRVIVVEEIVVFMWSRTFWVYHVNAMPLHGPLPRYVKLRFVPTQGIPGTFSTPPWVSLVIHPPCAGGLQLQKWGYKQQVLMHGHQGWNVRYGLCHICMRYVYIYIWVLYSFYLFCCLFIIVTWWYVWCIVRASGNQEEVQACLVIWNGYLLYHATVYINQYRITNTKQSLPGVLWEMDGKMW